ncbi:MAG TPA: VOC family protein [Candidatus Polarisedimenticolia bacterium]|nr:VOC family protein [Candidatus Polarisedimenticolia bacterium]
MTKSAKPIPEGYHTATPYLVQRDTKSALEYYKKAFGAETGMVMPGPDGRTGHAEIKIGDSMIFMSDEFPEMSPGTKSPQSAGCVTGTVFLYVSDVDTVFQRAVAAGAKVLMPVTDMFWGDRFGKIVDPFGHHWGIATRKEDLSPQEVQQRHAEFEKKMKK